MKLRMPVPSASQPDGSGRQDNNFALLRLLFASLVVISHAPELLDGDRHREILTRIFGTLSFGEAAVRGFFVISGYLITKSFVETRTPSVFLARRAARIIPGYLVCFLACVLLVSPLAGVPLADLGAADVANLAAAAVTLQPPVVPGVFATLPHPSLNGSMWTIGYEVACYAAAALAGTLGLARRRNRLPLALGVGGLLAFPLALKLAAATSGGPPPVDPALQQALAFLGIFGIGALFFLFRDRLPLTHAGAIAAGLALAALMFHRTLAGGAFAIFGGYLIFWFAFRAPVLRISRAAAKADISYGLYLFAWPLQNLIVWHSPGIDPWLLCGLALPGAAVLGSLSWWLVEKPSLRLARTLIANHAPARRIAWPMHRAA